MRSVKKNFGNEPRLRMIISISISLLLLWLLFSRAFPDYHSFKIRLEILIAQAKCPGLPGGSGSGGPDYINIAIDVGLGVVAAVFIYLTIRDLRRRRLIPKNQSEENDQDDL